MKIISIIPVRRGYSTLMDENQNTYVLTNKVIKNENILIGEIDDQRFIKVYTDYRKKLVLKTLSQKLRFKLASEKQLVQYLQHKNFNPSEIEYGVNLLKERMIINDDKLIENSISYYKENHLSSRYFISQKLVLTFGKEYREFIKEKIDKIYKEEEEVEVAFKLLKKKKIKNRERALILLGSRGFSISVSAKAYDKYISE